MNELAKALAKAQLSIKSAIKDSKGQIGQNREYKYADLASIMDACKKALSENGIAVIQKPDFNEAEMWLETVLIHESGDCIMGRYPLRPTQNTPQAYGSALTYARRYSLSSMVGVITEDDDGSAASQPAPRRDAPAPAPDEYEANLAKAQKWASDAIGFIEACVSAKEIDAWYGYNAAPLARLQKTYGDLFRQVTQAMVNQREYVAKQRDAAE